MRQPSTPRTKPAISVKFGLTPWLSFKDPATRREFYRDYWQKSLRGAAFIFALNFLFYGAIAVSAGLP